MADKKQNRRNNKNYDEDYNPRFRKQRKKVCVLCSDKNFELDYKNPEQLRKFINDKAKILPRRTTGACSKHQRDITIAVKRARQIAMGDEPLTKVKEESPVTLAANEIAEGKVTIIRDEENEDKEENEKNEENKVENK